MQNSPHDTQPRYRERLTPSLPFFVAIALAGPMVSLSFLPVGSVLALVLGLLATLAVLIAAVLASPVVSVEGSVLRAGRAHIDARWLGEPQGFTGDEAANVRGAGLDARGWHLIRGGVDGAVVVPNIDPADPVPSWTISTRTPDRLVAAISRARVAAR
ncbi:DUF3093 domain-containing protein [Microbacterium sp. NIBRBAC000506063]|uniref:DUF3093 domain-containing protein n=1 Tax=Microbacterium sp. NIBRBAC000506063 TaxID=2734618 RepID=UPI001BB5B5C2|nr:DUF3093 domain-containing protein [Microbacterium sp. NIBRBAC000506063]QTV79731.1 DUF3093 domain-containing protein [Microbacterium sp. NIBRBAC000506063]